jgi:hypothetical protein
VLEGYISTSPKEEKLSRSSPSPKASESKNTIFIKFSPKSIFNLF